MSLGGGFIDVSVGGGEAGLAAGLLVTGQKTSFHADDDGDLELGVAHDFSALTTGQYSGTTNITINSKVLAMSNAVVKDNNTELYWAREVPQTNLGPNSDGTLFWGEWSLLNKTTISFSSATKIIHNSVGEFDTLALCVGRKFSVISNLNTNTFTVSGITANDITVVESLADESTGASVSITTVGDLVWDLTDEANANSLGGHSDWRIPNKTELQSILNHGNYLPSINTTIFPSTPINYFWTSTTLPGDSTCAFLVYFGNGQAYYFFKTQSSFNVRLVRG